MPQNTEFSPGSLGKRIHKVVEQGAKKYYYTGVTVQPPFEVFSEEYCAKDAKWPGANAPGVYVAYNNESDEKPLYIGSSMVAVGKRIFNLTGMFGDKNKPYPNRWDEMESSATICVFNVKEEDGEFAPCLESYLIKHMKPLFNRKK